MPVRLDFFYDDRAVLVVEDEDLGRGAAWAQLRVQYVTSPHIGEELGPAIRIDFTGVGCQSAALELSLSLVVCATLRLIEDDRWRIFEPRAIYVEPPSEEVADILDSWPGFRLIPEVPFVRAAMSPEFVKLQNRCPGDEIWSSTA